MSRVIDGITESLGHQYTVVAAILVVVLWLFGGLIFGFTNTYQLIINTGTTIITFIMVFAIQHTANRETRAMNLKLDELIHSTGARNRFIGAEEESEKQLKREQKQEQRLRRDPSNNGNGRRAQPASRSTAAKSTAKRDGG